MSEPQTGTIVEGVGDELLHVIGLIIVVAVPFLVAYWNRLRLIESGAIHPDNVAQVEHTRNQLVVDASARNSAASINVQTTENGANGQASGDGRGGGGGEQRRYNADARCPVCLEEKEHAAETNCGHVFCGNCLVAYWRHGNWLGAVNCPVCRQMVTIILPVFREEEQGSDEGNRVLAEIRDYNRRFSGETRPLMDYIYDLPTLLRHAARDFFSLHGVVWMFRLRIIMCFLAFLLYLISPLDIIPEAIFGVLGFLDDFFIMLILAIYVTVMYRGIIAERLAGA